MNPQQKKQAQFSGAYLMVALAFCSWPRPWWRGARGRRWSR